MFGDSPVSGRVLVKICGITNAEDASAAVDYGADALGFNLYRGSRRYLDIAEAAGWIAELPAEVRKVAVMVNPTRDEAIAVAALPFIGGLQLHGMETPELCADLAAEGVCFAKALAVRDRSVVDALTKFATSTLVLDSCSRDSFGGSGTTFPWTIAREAVTNHAASRIILAGGLRPDNVRDAIHCVQPFGVDVTTGVEASPGRKDRRLLRAFVEAAHAA